MKSICHPREPKGAALIIVVAFLVLMSALVVAFYSRVGTELTSSRSYAEAVNVRQLADSAVGVVMGQIREATTVKQGAWASQPGMIRVYGHGGQADSRAHAFYKLYSSHDLIVSAKEMNRFDPLEFDQAAQAKTLEVPLGKGGWREQPAFFTDLNEPVNVPTNRVERAAGRNITKRYPIFDPAVAGLHEPSVVDPNRFERAWTVEGSSIALPKKLRENEEFPGSNEAPMPVRWIYVLRDGTLTAPTPLNGPASGRKGNVAEWQAISGGKHGVPTKTNPIVGRIAFWADDETSKVNVNTAGGFIPPVGKEEDANTKAAQDYAGSFWDTPRVQTAFDRGTYKKDAAPMIQIARAGLANAQPARNEFQRYAGHPSTTSLDVVFKNLLKERLAGTGKAFDSEVLYAWLPRITPGGSRGGTVRVAERELPIKSAKDLLDYPLYPDLNGKSFHTYDSLDEMLYSPENGERRLAEDFLKLPPDTITADLLDQTRFFLTTRSRSPELNLFGRPRVTLWPVWHEGPHIRLENSRNTPSDALLRFSSRVAGRDFIFARRDPYSPSADFEIPRNRALLEYLRRLTAKDTGKIPGFGGSFEEKFASAAGGRDQLLTQIFDYIRTINLKDTTRTPIIDESTVTDLKKKQEKERFMYAPRGLVVPTRAELGGNKVSGMGRYPTVSEASVVFYHAGWVGTPKLGPVRSERLIQDPDLLPEYDLRHKLVRAFLVFETYNPMQGYASTDKPNSKKERVVHRLELPTDFTIRTNSMEQPAPLGFSSKATNEVTVAPGDTWEGRNFGGTEGFFHTMRDKGKAHLWRRDRMDPNDKWPKTNYAFRTQASADGSGIEGVRVPLLDETFAFSGGKAELDIAINNHVVQTITLDFPPGVNWPLPRGLTEGERARLGAVKMPVLEGDDQVAALHADLGGFMKDRDLPAAQLKPRPPIRREWAFSFERRLAWMITANNTEEEHSYSPWSGPNGDGKYYTNRWRNILQPGDTIRSLIPGKLDQPDLADPRLIALQTEVDGIFHPHPEYNSPQPRAESLRRGDGEYYFPRSAPSGMLAPLPKGYSYPERRSPDLPTGLIAQRTDGKAADYDTGIGDSPDGGYGGKADEGRAVGRRFNQNTRQWEVVEPYFATHAYDGTVVDEPAVDTDFSPNRQISSAVAFGSLPARGRGWETLLFAPNPAGPEHPGLVSPRDHLLLDLFTMPVVEPYAISEPFSSAGKVNMNYQIMPFGYLKRSTAMRAALHSVRVTAIPQAQVANYKTQNPDEEKMGNVRYLVDRNETLRAFEDFFAEFKTDRNKGFFKSASEICDRFLYPKGDTHAGKVIYRNKNEQTVREHFWNNSALTGDNLREQPYADLYPRLTTKSNTYTVHYRVQTLRQRPYQGQGKEDAHYAMWDESRDSVLSEMRGQATIERYLDPSDRRFSATGGDASVDVEKESLEDAYRFRIVRSRQFSPW